MMDSLDTTDGVKNMWSKGPAAPRVRALQTERGEVDDGPTDGADAIGSSRNISATPRRRAAPRDDTKLSAPQDKDKSQLRVYLSPETDVALRARADMEGISLSALGEKAMQQYLSGLAADQVAAIAGAAIEEAVARRMDDLLRTLVVQPLRADLAVIHHEVAVARLQGYAHFGNDYGPDQAETLESVAVEQAMAARKAGTMARLHVLVEEDDNS